MMMIFEVRTVSSLLTLFFWFRFVCLFSWRVANMADEEKVQTMIALGFTEEQARHALQLAGNDLEWAVSLLVADDRSPLENVHGYEPDALENFQGSAREIIFSSYDDHVAGGGGELGHLDDDIDSLGDEHHSEFADVPELTQEEIIGYVSELMTLGFDEERARTAIIQAHGDIEAATNILLDE